MFKNLDQPGLKWARRPHISLLTSSEDVTIPDGSYEISQIQNYFLDEVIKKHESNVKSNKQSPILIYANRILNRVTFRIKTGYK